MTTAVRCKSQGARQTAREDGQQAASSAGGWPEGQVAGDCHLQGDVRFRRAAWGEIGAAGRRGTREARDRGVVALDTNLRSEVLAEARVLAASDV